MKKVISKVAMVSLIGAAGHAAAAISFVDIGTSAPPASLGTCAVVAFDQTAQAAVVNGTSVTSVVGGPNGTSLGLSPAHIKRNIGSGWATWSHGYTGAVYVQNGTQAIFNLPAGAQCFYFYAEPNNLSAFNITVTPASGSSVTRSVTGNAGAYGYGFYTSGETISSVTVDVAAGAGGFAVGEFGVGTAASGPSAIPTLSEWGMIFLAGVMGVFGFATLRRKS